MKSIIAVYCCILLVLGAGSVVIRNLRDYCTMIDGTVQCEGLNYGDFKEVEIDSSTYFNSEYFNYTNSNFYTIPRNAFRISNVVRYFYINNCSLKEIYKWNFYSGHSDPKTFDVDLNHNQIKKIPSNVFAYLPNLAHLYIRYNKISVLEVDCFKGLKYLTGLYLNVNEIQALHEGALDDLIMLEVINLSENRIEFLPGDIFKNNKKLTYIHLHSNLLKIIDLNVLRSRKVLQFILREFDESIHITPVSVFSLPSAEHLNISRNYFPYISRGSLSKLIKLEYFDAAEANLTYIEAGAFSHMTFLKHLNLSYNLLESFDLNLVSNLKKLEALHVNDNRLKAIDFNLLMKPPKVYLTIVGLEHNLFSCDHRQVIIEYLKEVKVEFDLKEQSCAIKSVESEEEEYKSIQVVTSAGTPKYPSITEMPLQFDEPTESIDRVYRCESMNLILTIFIAALITSYGIAFAFYIIFKNRSRRYNFSADAVQFVERHPHM